MAGQSVICPRCQTKVNLRFQNVRWSQGNPESAFYRCQYCGGEIRDGAAAEYAKASAKAFLENWRVPERSGGPSPCSGNGLEDYDSALS